MLNIEISIEGGAELEQRLNKLGSSLQDWKPELDIIGQDLVNFFSSKPFETQGEAVGENWPDLEPKYADEKHKEYPGTPVLIRTGLMSKSFGFRSSSLGLELFNSTDYFRNHQEGIGVPQRIMTKFDDQRIEAIKKVIVAGLQKRVNAS